MKKFLSMTLCLCMLLSLFAFAVTAQGDNPFVDVEEKDYFYEPVLWAVANNITAGTSATTFSPDVTCTRAQVVTFLWRAAGTPEPSQTSSPFTDVPERKFYYKAVLWAVENGITSGTSATTFSPEKPCTRAQVVTFLHRAAGTPEPTETDNPFTDVSAGKFYYKAVLWAVEEGITAGATASTFAPDKPCSRAQIVTFLYRYMNSQKPLAIVSDPADYYMGSSQEEASFTVRIQGGSAPYTYQWVVAYDNEEVNPQPVKTTATSDTLNFEFTDYDFDDYNNIGVYCVITDSKGSSVESKLANVFSKDIVPLAFAYEPSDYFMRSSQEDATFGVQVTGGVAPYTFVWIVVYDSQEVEGTRYTTSYTFDSFLWNFSDYDFDDYRDVGVYCIVHDSKGQTVVSGVADVHPYSGKALSVVSQPEDHHMTSSQEDATFTVQIQGGIGPYLYQWVVLYDNTEIRSDAIYSSDTTHSFTWNFSDYDFDDYNNVGVYCIITDSDDNTVESDLAEVFPKA